MFWQMRPTFERSNHERIQEEYQYPPLLCLYSLSFSALDFPCGCCGRSIGLGAVDAGRGGGGANEGRNADVTVVEGLGAVARE